MRDRLEQIGRAYVSDRIRKREESAIDKGAWMEIKRIYSQIDDATSDLVMQEFGKTVHRILTQRSIGISQIRVTDDMIARWFK